MSVFGRYADWYDLFYAGKDYRAEAAFVSAVLRQAGAPGGRLLEIGCGTGHHASWFMGHDWQTWGIDRSESMVAQARERCGGEGNARFAVGDVRELALAQEFDAAVSLFHVMSYLAAPGDLDAAFRAVRRHLTFGAPFLFDFWFGPAVLAQRPEVRQRTVENGRFRVTRTATPAMPPGTSRVDVHYDFHVEDKSTGSTEHLEETHRMRYLFVDEIDELARNTGFRLEKVAGWMEDRPADASTWNAWALLRASDGGA